MPFQSVEQQEFLSYGLKEISTLSNHYFQGDKEAQQQVKAEWEKLKYDLLLWKEEIPQELDNITPTEWSLKRLISMRTEHGHFYPKLVWIAEIILSLPMSNAWPERGASAVKRVKSRLRSSMTDQMSEALLHISINRPPVSEAQELKLLRPGETQRKEGNSLHLQIQVLLLLETRRVKFKPFLWTLLSKPISRSRKMKKLKRQVCKQRWKLLLKLLNLQTTKQVTIRMILLSKLKMNTKQSIAILGTRAFFCTSIF